jgi:prepilin-type N-terminal cleavage/methylation domain-containing protein
MKRHGGFTMIEVMAAMMLLAVVVGLSVTLLRAAAYQRAEIRQRHVAVQETASVIERLTALGWAELTPERARRVQLSDWARQSLPGARLDVQVVPATNEPQSKCIRAALTWRDRTGALVRPVRLVTWRYRAVEE